MSDEKVKPPSLPNVHGGDADSRRGGV
jgi:hypothetical protein